MSKIKEQEIWINILYQEIMYGELYSPIVYKNE